MKHKLLKLLVLVCLLIGQVINMSTVEAKGKGGGTTKSTGGGAIAGGGGDPSEARFDEIRADILKWIQQGGAQDLKLKSISYGEYFDKMTDLLAHKKVTVTFVVKDHPANKELQVNVKGKPKTCRGFISKNNIPNIVCNISRFNETTEAQKYRLIHHEYAGLVIIEKNEGAASDYEISNQITNYLSHQMVLKLSVKRSKHDIDLIKPELKMTKYKYISKGKIEIEISMISPRDIFQVMLTSKSINKCTGMPSKVILNEQNNFKFNFETRDQDCHEIAYDTLVQFTDGSITNLESFNEKPILQSYRKEETSPLSFSPVRVTNIVREVEELKINNLSIDTQTEVYNLSFNHVEAELLKNYRGVIIEDEEFMSDDSALLADHINSRSIELLFKWVQEAKWKKYDVEKSTYVTNEFKLFHPYPFLDKIYKNIKVPAYVNGQAVSVKLIEKGDLTKIPVWVMNFTPTKPALP